MEELRNFAKRPVFPLLGCTDEHHQARSVALGERPTFADLGQTAAAYFGVGPLACGTSFLREVLA